jgi:RNase P/RNase MRP subunit p30
MNGLLTGFSQWLTTEGAADVDLSSNLKENFNARRKWERAFLVRRSACRLHHCQAWRFVGILENPAD